MAKLTIDVYGDSTELLEFVELCAKIELLCNWGASREIPVMVDGDGSANLSFKVIAKVDGEDTDLIELFKEKRASDFEKETDSKIKTHYIGE